MGSKARAKFIPEEAIYDVKTGELKAGIQRIKESSIKTASLSNPTSLEGKLRVCLDPIIGEYGCLQKYNKNKFTCIQNQLPYVLECMYFGNITPKYCVSNTNKYTFPCDGDCDKNEIEIRKLYGCASSGGIVNSCDITEENWCECQGGKQWSNVQNKCACKEDEIDRGDCCTPPSVTCRDEQSEYYDCKSGKCECRPGYHRKDNDPSLPCIQACGESTQNNPINFTDPELGTSGCGSPPKDEEGYYGTLDDYCCDGGKCIKDLGEIDYVNKEESNDSKNTCILNNGIWRITDVNSCYRKGYCHYTECGTDIYGNPLPPEQSFQLVDFDEGLYTGYCDRLCAENKCQEACEEFAQYHGGVNPNRPATCDSTGNPPICKCWVND